MAIETPLIGQELTPRAPMLAGLANGDRGYRRQNQRRNDPYADISFTDLSPTERKQKKKVRRTLRRIERDLINAQLWEAAFELPDRMDDAEELDGDWIY